MANDRDLEQRLWKQIEKDGTGMLGLVGGPPRHMQPMTAFHDGDGSKGLWIFTRKDNDLLKEMGDGHAAMFTVMSKDHELIACIGGALSERYDPDKIDRFWNPVVAAWYPEGKDDPNLTLLRFDPEDAQVWASKGGAIRFGWEIAKANMTRKQPDIGESRHIEL
jgi:general stress protein 26